MYMFICIYNVGELPVGCMTEKYWTRMSINVSVSNRKSFWFLRDYIEKKEKAMNTLYIVKHTSLIRQNFTRLLKFSQIKQIVKYSPHQKAGTELNRKQK